MTYSNSNMPPKNSKSKLKASFIGELARNKKTISVSQFKIEEQNKVINNLEHILRAKKSRIERLLVEKDEIDSQHESLKPSLEQIRRKRRIENPTTDETNSKVKQRRRTETISACSLIHGASKENDSPVLTGMVDTVANRFKSDVVACKILSAKKSVASAITKRCEKKFQSDFYKSEENLLRSLNVYYSYNVMGKENT